jgi:outer membrane protein assembly factor BamB
MGVATGAAFDADGNLFVGDRSGTIFKIDIRREIFVHATLEPSAAAYHLAVNAEKHFVYTENNLLGAHAAADRQGGKVKIRQHEERNPWAVPF